MSEYKPIIAISWKKSVLLVFDVSNLKQIQNFIKFGVKKQEMG